MARNQRLFREDFDRNRTFVALKAFVFAGQGYIPGQALDTATETSLFTARRLRQLYDTRFIGYASTEAKVSLPAPATKPKGPRIVRRRFQPGVKADGVSA